MGIRYINQSLDKERVYFVGHCRTVSELFYVYPQLSKIMNSDYKRITETLLNQGFVSLLCDDLNIEYRIEVEDQ